MKTDTRTNHTRLARNASGRFLPRFHNLKVDRARQPDYLADIVYAAVDYKTADKVARRLSTVDFDRIGIFVAPSLQDNSKYTVFAESATLPEVFLLSRLARYYANEL